MFVRILKNPFAKISAVSAGNIFNAVIGLTFLTAVARSLSVDDFGRYALLTSLLVLISKVIDFGTNSLYVTRAIKNEEHQHDIFVTSKLVLFTAAIPLAIAGLYIVNLLELNNFLIFLVGLFAYGINYTFFALFQKLEEFHIVVGLNTLPALIKALGAILIFTGVITINLTSAFFIFSVSILFSAVFYFYLPKEFQTFSFNLNGVNALIKRAAPAGVSLMVNNGWSAIANSVAKIAKTFTDVGIFSVADKVANIFTLISVSIFTVLLPKNARRKKENLEYDLKETLLLSGGILMLALAVTLISQILVIPVFGIRYADSVGLLGILIFASAFTAINTFVDNYFFVEEKTEFLFYITSAKLVTFLVGAFVLIPMFALRGLAFAQLGAALVSLVLTFTAIWYRRT
jgi:O-antigen/teichoic acid export membrane protein